jgi:Sec-independent protein secretion pathway component TatC
LQIGNVGGKKARKTLLKNIREQENRQWIYEFMDKNTTKESFDKQSLTEHLRDLRSCLIVSLIATAVGFGASYAYIEHIGNWLFKPLTDVLPQGTSLIFTSYQEGFFFI